MVYVLHFLYLIFHFPTLSMTLFGFAQYAHHVLERIARYGRIMAIKPARIVALRRSFRDGRFNAGLSKALQKAGGFAVASIISRAYLSLLHPTVCEHPTKISQDRMPSTIPSPTK